MNTFFWSRAYCIRFGKHSIRKRSKRFQVVISDYFWQDGGRKMKQLAVVVSPHTLVWDPYLTLANVTFDLELSSEFLSNELFSSHRWTDRQNAFWDRNYFLVWFLVLSRLQSTDRQIAVHMSPPCKLHRWAQKWNLKWMWRKKKCRKNILMLQGGTKGLAVNILVDSSVLPGMMFYCFW